VVKSTSRNAKISLDSQQNERSAGGVTTVALVGFMGAGKTTVGQELARRLGWRFVDLDDLIRAAEGTTIEQIFQQGGEMAFRALERRILASALARNSSPLVLALGGGAFVDAKNRERLVAAGVPTVFLEAPAEELFQRSHQPEVVRPLRRNREQFCALYEGRRPAYAMAAMCVQTSGKEIGSIAEEIISALKLKAGKRD
jgi:shikimate kinase